MLWISIGFGVCVVALFKLLNFIDRRQMEQDIALILVESTITALSPMPSMPDGSIKVVDRAEIIPAISDECFEEAYT